MFLVSRAHPRARGTKDTHDGIFFIAHAATHVHLRGFLIDATAPFGTNYWFV
jgi:hypothetical protein